MDRLAIFVDMGNLYYAAQALGMRIDFGQLKELAARGRPVLRAIAYLGIDPADPPHGLITALHRGAGYKVITKPLRRFPDGTAKADLDIELAIDMLTLADHIETAILVSGDGDFTRLVETVQMKGVRVEIIALDRMTAGSLIDAADEFVNLADLADRLRLPERASPAGLVPGAAVGGGPAPGPSGRLAAST